MPPALRRLSLLIAPLLLAGCGEPPLPAAAPVPAAQVAARGESLVPPPAAAERREHQVRAPHGAERRDEYYWLRDDSRKDPAVLAFLDGENRHTDAVMKPLEGLREELYRDIIARIKQDDSTVPARDKDYWYYTRFEAGRDYPIHARRKGSMEAPEEILLDVNALAEGKSFFQVAVREISPDQQKLLYAEDEVGRRQYVLRIKDLTTGELLPDRITGASPSAIWGDDNRSIYYIENDPTTLLAKRVKRHVLGTDPAEDTLVYEEEDDSFYMGLYRTRSEQFLCIAVQSTVSSEARCTPAAKPEAFRVLSKRQRDFHYSANHLGDRWVIRTDWEAPNYRLMQAANDAVYGRATWMPLVEHDPGVFIEGFELFDGFIAVAERSEGLARLRVLNPDGTTSHVAADEPAYAMDLAANPMPDTDWLRYTYSSLATPPSTYELNVSSGERRLLKQEEVAGHDPANYVVERLWAPARDGLTQIPVSLAYRKGFEKDGSAALMQYGYGSYGNSIDPVFNPAVVNFLDRGMVYAIAHVRGGQEMGRQWYEDGKLLKKNNTFTDFIDVTDHLVAQGYAAKDRVGAMGGSAGGLLMGAISNMAPEKYRVILSLVPFVDVVTTMLDESIPLTTNEFDEWGNPKDPVYYDYMLGYSPYDQLKAQDYPAMFVGTGLWDSQVQYFEPAKYVARLRALKTDSQPLVFRTNMEAGHGGKSGRLQKYRETAEYQAFALKQLGVVE
ncbi:S9 family peptidase [Pseudomarimonas salicorniae]|uniref:S9 family peptidase n=1 Tax=Pseudomarimonas salicorniae TaxID=2933270 RepID=A0ABT0GHY7_9GAMM|nr:S9 family peptidase [Lysobacter sp. CAU 1642]MCK7593774.1 S9 family peptidase [Lysobacter sp. CAU 1642]